MAVHLAISKTLVIEMPRLLELFSGTGSVGAAFKEIGWDVVSLDIDPKFTPTIAADVMDWDHTTYPPGHFDVVWASVPCTEYSCAKTIGVRKLDLADSIVERTLKIIEYCAPYLVLAGESRQRPAAHPPLCPAFAEALPGALLRLWPAVPQANTSVEQLPPLPAKAVQ